MLRKRNDCEGDTTRPHMIRPEVRRVLGMTRTIAVQNGGSSIGASSEDGFMCVTQERSVLNNIYTSTFYLN